MGAIRVFQPIDRDGNIPTSHRIGQRFYFFSYNSPREKYPLDNRTRNVAALRFIDRQSNARKRRRIILFRLISTDDGFSRAFHTFEMR